MTFPSRGEPEFWRRYGALPNAVRQLAQKNYRLWAENAGHPSLQFKRINPPNWSVRIGSHYRAVGIFEDEIFVWQWIGTHEEYNKRY